MKKKFTNAWSGKRQLLTRFLILTSFFIGAAPYLIHAQCNWNSGTSYGTGTAGTTCIPTSTGVQQCHFFTEYATFNGLTVGQTYTITTTNTTTTTGAPFTVGVYANATSGTAPLASTTNATFPISVTFVATTTTVYTKNFKSGCISAGDDCNYFTLQCNSCTAPVAASTTQPSTATTAVGAASVQILRFDVPACSAGDVTSLTFNTSGSTNVADIANAKVYYTNSTTFSAATQFGSTVVNPNGSFTMVGSQSLPSGSTGYFWLTYDLACNATVADVLDAAITSYVFAGNTTSPATPNPTGTREITTATIPAYTATTTTTTVVGTPNLTLGRINIPGDFCNSVVTSVKFNTATSPAADIAQAKCYYTTSTTFGTDSLFGLAVLNPNGDIVFNGSKTLAVGTGNYFWLVYDISCSAGTATGVDSVIATPVSITTNAGVINIATPATNAKKKVNAQTVAAYTATTTTTTVVGTANVSLGRINIPGDNCNSTVTSVKYNTATSLAADIAQAKCYYTTSTTFGTDSLFGTAVLNPNGDIVFNGSKTLAVGTGNYFWLVYDISCSAGTVAGVDSVVAIPVSITTNAGVINVATPATNASKKVNAQTVPAYTATTTTSTIVGTTNLTLGRINIPGDICNSTVTSVKYNTATSPAADITQARCYYTTSTTFGTDSLFGTAALNPNGDITFNGSKILAVGTGNYFWLVYDISCSAGTVTGIDSVVATPVSITTNAGIISIATPSTNAKKKVTAQTVPAYTATTTTSTTVGIANLTLGRTTITGDNCNSIVTSVKFNTAVSPAADIAQARCYYTTGTTFNTDSLFGAPIINPNGDMIFNGSKTLATGSGNNFWLVYDISCSAGSAIGVDSVVATPVSITTNAGVISIATPTTNAKKKVNAQTVPAYTATTTTSVIVNTTNLTLGRVNIPGDNCNSIVTSVKFNTAVSPAADIAQARCYYTTGTTFNTDSLFGAPIVNPNGDMVFNGSKTLAVGTGNNFWLVYDIPCGAGTVAGVDSVVAVPVSITTNAGVISITTPSTNAKKGIIGISTATTIADGDWNSPSIWPCGMVPTSNSNVVINHAVTVTTSGNLAANITINAAKSLTVSSGSLTMGANNGDNKVLTNNGTLTVSSGTFNINGRFVNGSTGTINQSGGNINVDPNASGTGTSVSGSGNYPINWTVTTAANLNLTGGVFTLVDPPAATSTPDYAMYITYTPVGSVSAGPNHTFRFGNGVSTDLGSANGFRFYSWAGSGIFKFGKLILEANTANAATRFVYNNGTFFPLAAIDDITIKSGAELRQTATALTGGIFVGKNLTVESGGTLTVPGIIYFGNVTSSSSTVLVGSPSTSPQIITGTGGIFRNATTSPTANFASLTINNSSVEGVTFADANSLLNGTNTGTVSGTLTMTAGKVNVGTNTLVLGISAASTGTYTYTDGMIIGSFKRWLGNSTGARAFDIGMGNVGRKVSINFTTAPTTGGSLTAKWNSGAPGSAGLPLTEGSNTYTNTSQNGYWTVSAGDGLTGGTYTVAMTLTGGSDAPDYSTVTIGKRATSADPWALVGTAVAPTGSASNFTVSRTGVTGFSDFTLLLTTTPLSVKLSSFTGRNAGTVNILNWATATEKDASHFDVLRSDDGNRFEKLTTVDAKNVMTGSKYEFTDTKPFEGKNFYRLNMVDVNGKSAYSDVVVLSVKSSAGLSLVASPNPVNQTLNVSINGKIDGKATIQVVDITGKLVQKIQVSSNNTGIDMSTLSNGTYIIKYNDSSNASVIKVIKN